MNSNKNTEEVQNRGQNSADDDIGVRHTHIVGHKEGGSSHDGGHYLSTGGSRSFNRSGKLRLISVFLHHGNRYGAGGNGVADGRAGNHSAECGGDNSDFRGTAGGSAEEAVGKAYEIFRDAGFLKEGTEDDKNNYVLGANINGSGQYSVFTVKKLIEHTLKGKVLSDKGIKHKEAGNAENGQTHASAAEFYNRIRSSYTTT